MKILRPLGCSFSQCFSCLISVQLFADNTHAQACVLEPVVRTSLGDFYTANPGGVVVVKLHGAFEATVFTEL
jgi:hypothetical protein